MRIVKPGADEWSLMEQRGDGRFQHELTRQQLAKNGIEYRPYLYANRLFDTAWPAFREPIERHVRPFVDGQVTMDRMTTELARALP
jgi:hypothetical protein